MPFKNILRSLKIYSASSLLYFLFYTHIPQIFSQYFKLNLIFNPKTNFTPRHIPHPIFLTSCIAPANVLLVLLTRTFVPSWAPPVPRLLDLGRLSDATVDEVSGLLGWFSNSSLSKRDNVKLSLPSTSSCLFMSLLRSLASSAPLTLFFFFWLARSLESED